MSTTITPSDGSRVVLRDVDWPTYERLRKSPDNVRVRMTYDRGVLELMSPSMQHERLASLIGRLIGEWTLAWDVPIQGCRTTTFKRQDLLRGLEPDDCYYVQNEPAVRGRNEVDLSIDPPPDLAIEVDITSSSEGRLPIYAALGVPEVWRCDGKTLRVYVHREGRYGEQERSIAFPELLPADIMRFVERSAQTDDTSLVREFREWINEKTRQT